ncbi:DUF3302 domain-containing protein [Accumulibacter sp.]|uniref:DUF3302 domain-containing protein n=1 Tax=Accumulibacter sp. TaxID=2053492 RepID=UPI0028C50C1E|nr:DUF3302 domain-containing protein [Accumulibacter sp.]
MLGFEIDFWDYLTFLTLFLAGAAGVGTLVWLAGLPGRIAIARKHPEAEAVKLLGWAGLLPTIYPWVQAFIWAFKPTDIVDIRRFPREEARAIDEEIARLEDKPKPKPAGAARPAAEPLPAATPRAGDDS